MLSKKLSAAAKVGLCAAILLHGPVGRAHAQDEPHKPLVARPDSIATPEDPDNLAKQGYSPADIKNLYRVRRQGALSDEARLWVEQGRFTEAIAQLKAVLKETKNEPTAWLGLAEAYAASGDTKQAIETYRFLLVPENHPKFGSDIESDPRYMEAFVLLLHQSGSYDEAWAWHQRALRRMAEYHISGTDLIKAIPLNPQTASTVQLPFISHLIISDYHLCRPEYSSPRAENKAVYEARAAVRLRPNQAIGHLYLGYALIEQARAMRINHYLAVTYPEKMREKNAQEFREFSDASVLDRAKIVREEGKAELEAAARTGSATIKAAAEQARIY